MIYPEQFETIQNFQNWLKTVNVEAAYTAQFLLFWFDVQNNPECDIPNSLQLFKNLAENCRKKALLAIEEVQDENRANSI